MSADHAEKVMVKVTIAADENPELFRAVTGVKGIRRRSARIRDLAIGGLAAERARPASPVASPRAPVLPSIAKDVPLRLPTETVDDMLNWSR
jgi:hypothetical protein